jgi:hypothetical protein
MTVLAGLLALAIMGMTAWACSSSDTGDLEDQIDQLTQQVDDLHAHQQQAEMFTALYVLNNSGLHPLDEAASAGEELPAGASGMVDRALLVVATTDWPEDLQASADEMQTALQDLATALDGGDMDAIASAASAAHETFHPFSDDIGTALNTAAGLEGGGHDEAGDGMDMGMEPTPTP